MSTWAMSLASVIAVSLASLIGLATLPFDEVRVRRAAMLLVSFAVGALLGDAFLHLIPHVFADAERSHAAPAMILTGILLFFVLEKVLRRWHAVPCTHDRPAVPAARARPLAIINLAGDAVHNFVDGVLIGSSYMASPTLGFATTVAVLLHELPQELGDFGILIHSGLTVRRAVLLNLACASVAVLGTIGVLLFEAANVAAATDYLIPLTAGGFVYIALADLVPELQHEHGTGGLLVQSMCIGAGLGVMALLTLVA